MDTNETVTGMTKDDDLILYCTSCGSMLAASDEKCERCGEYQ